MNEGRQMAEVMCEHWHWLKPEQREAIIAKGKSFAPGCVLISVAQCELLAMGLGFAVENTLGPIRENERRRVLRRAGFTDEPDGADE